MRSRASTHVKGSTSSGRGQKVGGRFRCLRQQGELFRFHETEADLDRDLRPFSRYATFAVSIS